jgi:two-component system LytT family sensor kinase
LHLTAKSSRLATKPSPGETIPITLRHAQNKGLPFKPMKIAKPKQKQIAADSTEAGFWRGRWTLWAMLLLFWLALGLFSVGAPFLGMPQLRRTAPPPGMLSPAERLFLMQFASWLAWAAFAPAVFWLRRRWPLERGVWKRSLPVHVAAVALLCAAHSVLAQILNWLIIQGGRSFLEQQWGGLWLYWWVRDLQFSALFYGLILGISSALEFYRQFRERELRASQLETQLTQAQLQMLKMQLHPHFLFNTLNGITGLVRDNDNAAAVQMLVGLSDLLRQTLDNSGKQEVRLGEELEWLELYLKLQQMRFSDRLQISIEAAPQTLDVLVPNLITQPVVENAIRHGLASRVAPGLVSLTAQRVGERLELRIRDDGVGLPEDWRLETNQGLGLANTSARLRQLFGTDFKLEVHNREQGGVEALISIPLKLAAAT